jgi:hypothetical protein
LGKQGVCDHHEAVVSSKRFMVKMNRASVQNIGDRWGMRGIPENLVI